MANQQGVALIFWLRERGRDALMWPVNLVRGFPVRSSRIILTLWQGLRGIEGFPAELFDRGGEDTLFRARWLPGRMIYWLHQFLNQLFDLLGGPELAQLAMHLVTNTTPLTPEEIALAVSVMGPGRMRYHQVRVAEGGLLDLIFKLNGNLAYTTWQTIHFPRDVSQQDVGQQDVGRQDVGRQSVSHTRANANIFIHEMLHVYQYERVGSRYLGEAIYMLVKSKRRCYDYGSGQGLREAYAAGKRYADFNREQQAQMVQDYFSLRQRGEDVMVHEPFMTQMRAGQV